MNELNIDYQFPYEPSTFDCEQKLQELERKSERSEEEELCYKILSSLEEQDDSYEYHLKNMMISREKLIEKVQDHIADPDEVFPTHGLYFDWNGNEIHHWEWLFKKTYLVSHVASHLVNNKIVSTVWLGLNHGWFGKKLIFETMIFNGVASVDDYQERYETLEEAIEGHKIACKIAGERN